MKADKNSKRRITLDEISKEPGFAMPEGYFDRLEGVKVRPSVWDSLSKETYFTCPEGYFEALPGYIQQRVAPKGYFDWSKVSKEQFIALPEGYFDDLPYRIAERIRKKRTSIDWKLILSLLSPRYVLPLAIGCFMIGYAVVKVVESGKRNSFDVAQLDNAAIQEYLIDHQLLSDEQVADKIPAHRVLELESAVPNGISKEEMEDNMDMSSLDESTI